MLQRVRINGIELPKLYIAENSKDAELAKSNGIPFVRWNRGQDELIKIILRPVLENLFPHIKWSSVLGRRRKFKTVVELEETDNTPETPEQIDEVGLLDEQDITESKEWKQEKSDDVYQADILESEDGTIMEESVSSNGERVFDCIEHDMVTTKMLDIEDYVGDLSSQVNLEVLQRLRLMPAFIGNILDCVKLNIGSGVYWSEGYNKKLGLPVGRFDSSRQKPNLIILDVSGSIPRGISATMIALIDTMRTQLSADLIITGSNSRFYPMGSTLPDPQTIRDDFGLGNESYDFFNILTKNIRGKSYGHVFSFGDWDTPNYYEFEKSDCYSLAGTTVEYVHHYHTGVWSSGETGYAKWCHMLSKQPLVEYDTSWCKVIKN